MTKYFQWLMIGLLVTHTAILTGCGDQKKKSAKNSNRANREPDTLNVLCIDSPMIAKTSVRHWSAEGLGTANFTEMTAAELTKSNFQLPDDVDVVVYPSQLMADLIAQSQLLAIPKKYMDDELVNAKEMLNHQQKFLRRYGGEFHSFPLGDAYLTLMYNQKLFDELGLKVPETWGEYSEVAKQLQDAGHVVQEPLADGWASQLFLNRAAAYVRSRGKVSTVFEISDMKPLINSEPFAKTLGELKASLGGKVDAVFSPAQIFSNLVSGEAAMGLTWPSRHFIEDESGVNEELAIARMPGATDWYNHLDSVWTERDPAASPRMELMGCTGRLVSVSKGAANTSAAIEFASWLCSKPTSTIVSIESPHVSMFRATHLGQPSRWAGENIAATASDQFGEVIREISESEVVFLFPRIPGQAEYLNVLDQAVISAARGETEIDESLAEVSKKWEAITERLGREEQIKRLRMSEGYSR